MKEYTFIAWCSCGTEETEVGVELTDEQGDLLEEYGRQADVYYDGFENCEPLKQIYDEVYAIAVEQITEEIREWGEDDNAEDPEWQANKTYLCGVEFPREFEESFEDDSCEDEM